MSTIFSLSLRDLRSQVQWDTVYDPFVHNIIPLEIRSALADPIFVLPKTGSVSAATAPARSKRTALSGERTTFSAMPVTVLRKTAATSQEIAFTPRGW